MKKLALMLTLMMLGASLVGCGKETDEVSVPEVETITETEETTTEEEATEDVAEEETPAAEGETEAETEENAGTEEAATGEGYEDNFAVDKEAAAEFAKQIQAVVEEENLEGLADLMGFPTWVGFADGGSMVETRDDFIALGAEKIFTEEMKASIADANLGNLAPSMAGFSLSKDGKPNIVFSVWEGELKVSGMNY